MKIFCDTNVVIAAFLTSHPHHHAARPVVERVRAKTDAGFVAAHSLAEAYAVLTRLPGANYVAPAAAWQLISENIIQHFSIAALAARDYSEVLERAAYGGVEGGRVYDALLLAAAAKSGAERIYTFNIGHFQNLADEDLRRRIVAP
jgi:predicted nucleic acid-binding protein